MASLKELRNRIASVKATQKITRAMQMVAASKLRRAQAAAEAARPYAARMSAVLANLAATLAGRADAPRLLAGTGRDETHLLVVCTAERGLCGAFNSSIARLARDHALRLTGEGKKVKILCVGKKGLDVLRRQFASQIIDLVDLREVKRLGFRRRRRDRRQGARPVRRRRVRRLHAVLFRVQVGDQPGADGAAAHPGRNHRRGRREPGGGAAYEYEPDEESILADLLPRNLSVQIFRALLENAARRWAPR